MPNFQCVHCGNGSLVRSNFKLTPDRRPYCRDEVSCAKRRGEWPNDRQYDHHVGTYSIWSIYTRQRKFA